MNTHIHTKTFSEAAAAYCRKCVEMGAPWVVYDSMTERLKYRYTQMQHRDTFDTTWTHSKRFTIDGDGAIALETDPRASGSAGAARQAIGAAPAAVAKAVGALPAATVPKAVGAAPPAARPATARPAEGDDGRAPKRPRLDGPPPAPGAASSGAAGSSDSRAVIQARREKAKAKQPQAKPKAKGAKSQSPEQAFKTAVTKYVVLSASAASLIDTIARLEEWVWARTDNVLGELIVARDDLVGNVHELVNMHIGEGWKSVVDSVAENELNVLLSQIASDLDPKLDTLQGSITRIKDMHARMTR